MKRLLQIASLILVGMTLQGLLSETVRVALVAGQESPKRIDQGRKPQQQPDTDRSDSTPRVPRAKSSVIPPAAKSIPFQPAAVAPFVPTEPPIWKDKPRLNGPRP